MTPCYEEKRQLLNFLFDGKDYEGIPYGIYIDKAGKHEWEVFIYGCLIGDGQRTAGSFIIKGEDLDSDESCDFVKDVEEIRPEGDHAGLDPFKKRKTVVLDRRNIRDMPLEGPQYENWLEYIKQGEDYTTSDVIQEVGRSGPCGRSFCM